jgi:UDP-N-acetylmuramoyl-tripeptide--D-alanyl-D-alanine ligase
VVERSVLENRFSALGGLKNMLPVEDTIYALQEMSHLHRRKFTIPVVGITGTNGKTTTKEMLASILKRKGQVLKNEGNLNNHLGVPLTLLKLAAEHRSAVVEMGMSARGEIDRLARLTDPDVAVITNIGPAHLEFLKTLDNVAEAKGELLDNLKNTGIAVLNADDPYFDKLKKKFNGAVLSFGIDGKADVSASAVTQGKDFTDFTITSDDSRVDVRLRTVGKHNIYNALAAAAAARAVGMPGEAVKLGLDDFVPVAMRSELRQVEGRTVLADYYNANPSSMEAALSALVSLRTNGKAIAVLGDMLELGDVSEEAHRSIGRMAATLAVDILITIGQRAQDIAAGARDAGMPEGHILSAASQVDAADLLKRNSRPGDVILIKGSRGMKLEKILEAF